MCNISEYFIEQATEIGLARGMAQGMAQGETLLATLISRLLAAGRNSDIEAAARDENARKLLYKEFGLID